MYKILAIDGGGVRGIIAARVLTRVSHERPLFLEATSCFAGTSSGAISALAVANSVPPEQIAAMFEQKSAAIFDANPIKRLLKTWGLLAAKYNNKMLFESLSDLFKNARLSDLKKHVVVSSFELDPGVGDAARPRAWQAKFFHNFHSKGPPSTDLLIDIAMRSCAAPTYLPIYQGFIDGGVVANNPSMCALAQAIDPAFGEAELNDVVLLSIGSGVKSEFDPAKSANRGLLQWGFKILSIVFQGSIGLANYQCRQILGERYYRVNIEIPSHFNIDDTSKMQKLLELADQIDITELLQWLDQYWIEHDKSIFESRNLRNGGEINSYQRFEEALAFTLKWEGGYVDDAIDPGGATNFGITQKVYDSFRTRQKLPLRAVALIAPAEVRAIYFNEYWLAGHCHSLHQPLSTTHFDTCVNFGVHQGVKFLQAAVNATADGIFGPLTALKVANAEPLAAARNICSQRITFRKNRVRKYPQFQKFLEGWLNRDKALQAYIQAHVESVDKTNNQQSNKGVSKND